MLSIPSRLCCTDTQYQLLYDLDNKFLTPDPAHYIVLIKHLEHDPLLIHK